MIKSADLPRVQNRTSDEHCRYCCEGDRKKHSGLIRTGGTRPRVTTWEAERQSDGKYTKRLVTLERLVPGEFEYFGPCPFCEVGRATEFPEDGWGPWGSQGYWDGFGMDPRTMGLEPICQCDVPPMGRAEGLKKLNELKDRLTRSHDLAEQLEEQESEEERKRKAVLDRALAKADQSNSSRWIPSANGSAPTQEPPPEPPASPQTVSDNLL